MSVYEDLKLRCKQCNGGSATQLITEMSLSECTEGFENRGGKLGCAALQTSTGTDAAKGEL
jgi:hypothetical protein